MFFPDDLVITHKSRSLAHLLAESQQLPALELFPIFVHQLQKLDAVFLRVEEVPVPLVELDSTSRFPW